MSLDDPARVERLLDDCIRRGLVEQVGESVRGTRLWKGWLQKASEVINRQVAETGAYPSGHPVHLAVEKALAMKGEALPADARGEYVQLLTLLELADMPASTRGQYGAYP